MVGGTLTSPSVFRVGLGFCLTAAVSGSRAHPSYSCDGWVCALEVMDTSLIFGLVRGTGTFVAVLPTFIYFSFKKKVRTTP